MIIDAHTHGFYGKYLDRVGDVGGDWGRKKIAAERIRAKERPQYLDPAFRVEQLKKYGIDFQVVTPSISLDVNLLPGNATGKLAFARELNDNMARLMEDTKGTLIAVGTIPLASLEQGGLKEIERVIKTLGLKGINIVTNIEGKPIDAPEFESFWAKAAEMDIPVYIHPRHPATQNDRSYEAEYDLTHNFGWPFETVLSLSRLVFSGIMERYPTLKIVSHHLGGGMVPFFWGRILETYEPSRQQKMLGKVMPRPLFDYFSRFYYDTAVGGSAAAIRCAYDVFGADRLLFATDAPNGPQDGEGRLANYPNVIRSLGLSKAENEKLFEGNARKLLKLK